MDFSEEIQKAESMYKLYKNGGKYLTEIVYYVVSANNLADSQTAIAALPQQFRERYTVGRDIARDICYNKNLMMPCDFNFQALISNIEPRTNPIINMVKWGRVTSQVDFFARVLQIVSYFTMELKNPATPETRKTELVTQLNLFYQLLEHMLSLSPTRDDYEDRRYYNYEIGSELGEMSARPIEEGQGEKDLPFFGQDYREVRDKFNKNKGGFRRRRKTNKRKRSKRRKTNRRLRRTRK